MSEPKAIASHRPLERFITLMVVGLTLFCVAAAGLGAFSIERQRADRAVESARDEISAAKKLELAVLMKQIQLDIVQVQQFLTDVSATRGLAGLDDGWKLAEQNAQAFKADVARARGLAEDLNAPNLVVALNNVASAFPAYYLDGQTMAHAYVDGGADAGNTHMEAFDNASLALAAEMDGARAAILTMDAQAAERDKATEARLRGAQTLSTILCGGMALGACVLGAVVIALTRKRLLRPLAILSDYMGCLAQGDYEREPPFGKRSDELGTMARSIAVFREAAIERRQAREAQEADRDAMEAERRQNEQERASTDTERTRVVSRLAEALGKLSDGDLTSRIETPFPPAFEVLRSDFNSAIARLSTALGAIATGAASMQNGSEEIASAADDLSRRTEQQAASLEQTAAALDEIAQTVNRSTAGAKEAATAVALAKSDAEKSGEVVNRAVAAMSEIENSSTQISRIIGVIDEIAFQTNLLALNAGVEAARAGDSGRGFAVVAQEVRALAQRSADAAKQIKGLITQSGAQVAAGVDLVGQTGQTLHKIVQEVIRVDTLVNDIARSAEEQSVGLRQVNTAVNHMDQVTQQNAAMVEQTTAATHSLRSEAIDLARQVAEFKLGPATVSNLRRVA